MAHNLPPEDVTWDVVTGVSAGAVNTAGVSVWEVGKEKEMTEFLIDTLENMHTEDIYKFWDGDITEGIFNRSGFFNSTPMLGFI